MFGDEYYTGSKVGVHTYLGTILYWFKGRSSYTFGNNFILVQKQEFILIWRKVLYWFKGRSSYLFEESFILVQM